MLWKLLFQNSCCRGWELRWYKQQSSHLCSFMAPLLDVAKHAFWGGDIRHKEITKQLLSSDCSQLRRLMRQRERGQFMLFKAHSTYRRPHLTSSSQCPFKAQQHPLQTQDFVLLPCSLTFLYESSHLESAHVSTHHERTSCLEAVMC